MATLENVSDAVDAAMDAVHRRMGWASLPLEERKRLLEVYRELLDLQFAILNVQLTQLPDEVEEAIEKLKTVTKIAKERAEKIERNTRIVAQTAEAISILSGLLLFAA